MDKKYIVILEDNYADEFDIKDVKILNEENFLRLKNNLNLLFNNGNLEIYFGTNEYLKYNNINELISVLKFEEIENYNEIKKYEKYFPDMDIISTLEDLISDKLYEVITFYLLIIIFFAIIFFDNLIINIRAVKAGDKFGRIARKTDCPASAGSARQQQASGCLAHIAD